MYFKNDRTVCCPQQTHFRQKYKQIENKKQKDIPYKVIPYEIDFKTKVVSKSKETYFALI